MAFTYDFVHTCGHLGNGFPIFEDCFIPEMPEYPDLLSKPMSIQLTLYFPCPFCSVNHPAPQVKEGEGLLVLLAATFPIEWRIIRACTRTQVKNDIDSKAMAMQRPDGGVNHWAWLAKPAGDIMLEGIDRVAGAATETGTTEGIYTDVSCTWKQRGDTKIGEGRIAGLWSQLNAAVLSGEMAGRYSQRL